MAMHPLPFIPNCIMEVLNPKIIFVESFWLLGHGHLEGTTFVPSAAILCHIRLAERMYSFWTFRRP